MTQKEYDEKYPKLEYTVYTNWNEPKAVPGKPENDVERDFGFTDNRLCIEGYLLRKRSRKAEWTHICGIPG